MPGTFQSELQSRFTPFKEFVNSETAGSRWVFLQNLRGVDLWPRKQGLWHPQKLSFWIRSCFDQDLHGIVFAEARTAKDLYPIIYPYYFLVLALPQKMLSVTSKAKRRSAIPSSFPAPPKLREASVGKTCKYQGAKSKQPSSFGAAYVIQSAVNIRGEVLPNYFYKKARCSSWELGLWC